MFTKRGDDRIQKSGGSPAFQSPESFQCEPPWNLARPKMLTWFTVQRVVNYMGRRWISGLLESRFTACWPALCLSIMQILSSCTLLSWKKGVCTSSKWQLFVGFVTNMPSPRIPEDWDASLRDLIERMLCKDPASRIDMPSLRVRSDLT